MIWQKILIQKLLSEIIKVESEAGNTVGNGLVLIFWCASHSEKTDVDGEMILKNIKTLGNKLKTLFKVHRIEKLKAIEIACVNIL